MNIHKSCLILILLLTILVSTACSGAPAPSTTATAQPRQPETVSPENPSPAPAQPRDAGAQAVLLFGIGMHIEPHGAIPSQLVGLPQKQIPAASPGRRSADYNQLAFFERSVQDLQTLAQIIEQHSGRMTIQAQTPFTQVAIDNQDPILSSLAQAGHEIALHFHEDAHLGRNSTGLPVETWCAVLKEEIALVEQASGVGEIEYWSGGNLYPRLFEAAACAGLQVNSDWKNPKTQSSPIELTGVHPWRPAGGTDGEDFSQLTSHDPQGPIVFLPEGQYSRGDFASMRRSETAGGDQAYFDFLEQSLLDSLEAAQAGKVNVFHFTVHPGEFRGDPAQPFQVIERFLSEVVDPLVQTGQVRWATFSEMSAAYQAWEQANPAVDPFAQAQPEAIAPTAPSTAAFQSAGHITFAINVHDWVHAGESADTLIKLVDLFEQYGVRGDFYFTAPVVEAYARERPDLIERFRNSDMTISYHIRPPHPLYSGFDQRLQGLDDATVYQTLLDYETYALDLETGDLDRSKPGGYAYVAQVFGRPPVVASAPNKNLQIKQIAQQVYADLGAQMAVLYHEEGADPANPFERFGDVWVRPSDFSVTRTTLVNGSENFWWNYMSAADSQRYQPLAILQLGLQQWQETSNQRLPFITALIHENNFYRSGPEAWTSFYYTLDKGKRFLPLSPPFNLDAQDASVLRPASDQQAIWLAYEQLVAYAAQHLQVVTSLDIVRMAEQAGHAP